MPIKLKIFLTWAILFLCICSFGALTIGNTDVQAALKSLVTAWLCFGVIGGLMCIWIEL